MPTNKVIVLFRSTLEHIALRVREELPNGEVDEGGVCATVLSAASIDSICSIPAHLRRRGRWAPTHAIGINGYHIIDDERVTMVNETVPLSTAYNPFLNTHVKPYIRAHPHDFFIGPAYRRQNHDGTMSREIADTQICVSGGIDDGEEPIDAAYRELREEIGIPPRTMTFQSAVSWKGRQYYLFFADA